MKIYHKIIIGAGIYGLYAAFYSARKSKNRQKILILEQDAKPFQRATYLNQARVHQGYHYPRSISTALKSKKYFERFNEDFSFCILKSFAQIYATATNFSWTNAEQFQKFCHDANIFCEPILTDKYFQPNTCSGAFLTKENTYDAMILRDYFQQELQKFSNVELKCGVEITEIKKNQTNFTIKLADQSSYQSDFILNATYASINQIHQMLGFEPFQLKYERCEIILGEVSANLKNVGLTVMDGPFFSLMPFGKTGLHSLTSVTFTPHETSFSLLPQFNCQDKSAKFCTPLKLGNCNHCEFQPKSAQPYMINLTKKYLRAEFKFHYQKSLFSMKPILIASEIDDSRPTIIKQLSCNPTFISVLSGKINTIYDLDEVL